MPDNGRSDPRFRPVTCARSRRVTSQAEMEGIVPPEVLQGLKGGGGRKSGSFPLERPEEEDVLRSRLGVRQPAADPGEDQDRGVTLPDIIYLPTIYSSLGELS